MVVGPLIVALEAEVFLAKELLLKQSTTIFGISFMCQYSSTDQEELETDSTVHEILEVNEEVQDVDNILLIISQTTK